MALGVSSTHGGEKTRGWTSLRRRSSGQSVSAADKEAWRRWAKAGGPRPRRKKKKKKRKLSRTSLRPAARVPAVQARDHGGAPVPVDRVLGVPVACRDRCAQCTLQVCGNFTGAAFGQVVVLPVWDRTGVWPRQCCSPSKFRTRSSWPRLTCSSLCSDRCSGPDSAVHCLEAHRSSSRTRMLTCPFFFFFQRHRSWKKSGR